MTDKPTANITPLAGKPEVRPQPSRVSASALSLGTQLAAGMVFFAGLGWLADHRTGGGVRWTLCGMFAGLAYGAYEVWKVVQLMNEETKKGQPEAKP